MASNPEEHKQRLNSKHTAEWSLQLFTDYGPMCPKVDLLVFVFCLGFIFMGFYAWVACRALGLSAFLRKKKWDVGTPELPAAGDNLLMALMDGAAWTMHSAHSAQPCYSSASSSYCDSSPGQSHMQTSKRKYEQAWCHSPNPLIREGFQIRVKNERFLFVCLGPIWTITRRITGSLDKHLLKPVQAPASPDFS